MSHTYVFTKIYEVRQSRKGWSESYEFFFHKEKAIKACRELQIWAEEHAPGTHFRVREWTCEDSIIYFTDQD